MNKLILVVLYGCISITAMANSPPGHGSGDSHHSGTSGDSSAAVSIGSDSQSIDLADSSSQEAVSSNQTITNIKREASEVANAVASLSLPFCGEGSAGSTKFGSFSIGGSSYSCEVSRLVAVMDAHSSNLLMRANNYPAGSFERNQALARAAHIQTKIYNILGEEAVNYLTNRGTTASWSTWIKDLWPLVIGLALIL